jgi:hypothetical protein
MTTPSTPAAKLFKALSGKSERPLDPGDPAYVPLFESTSTRDPILRLHERMARSESESVNLLTGFRGNGKSTQLRRLRKMLKEDAGFTVVLVDMADYVMFTKPIELSDFVLSLSAALAKAVKSDLGLDHLAESYFKRFGDFLKTTKVEFEGLDLGVEPAKLSLKLKREAGFKERIQVAMRSHVGALVQQAATFVSEIVDAIRAKEKDPNRKVALLVDSLEQLRGVGEDGDKVHASVVQLFAGEAASLEIPKLHVVYTVPPYLTTLAPNFGRAYGGVPVTMWPNVHVRSRDGSPDATGLAVVRNVVEKRCAEWREVLSDAQLDRLAGASGGDLRDLFRLVRETALDLDLARRDNPQANVDDKTLNYVEQQLMNELAPHATNDLERLAKVAETKSAALSDVSDAKTLARFFDSNWIMNYLNGEPWFDVHPLLQRAIERHRAASGGTAPTS